MKLQRMKILSMGRIQKPFPMGYKRSENRLAKKGRANLNH